MIPGLILIAVVVLLVLVGVGLYNRLVALRNQVEQRWADIDVQLRRRHDLIPNLVETVKGYATHEREVFERVTEARSQAVAAGGVREQAQAEGMLTEALRSLFAVAENYPQLQADTNFLQLQAELTATENRLSSARSAYNAIVRAYDTAREQVPMNIIAGMFGFEEKPYFEVDEPDARDPVKVEF
ncbi:MAG: LemA family protein [Actinobacteria bacterium]|nr:LemA family protein [Actinomycetota bacterium]